VNRDRTTNKTIEEIAQMTAAAADNVPAEAAPVLAQVATEDRTATAAEASASMAEATTSATAPPADAPVEKEAPKKLSPFSANNGATRGPAASPFSAATSTNAAASPFGADFSQTRKPLAAPTSFEPEEMEDDGPWWGFIKNISTTQIAIVASFSLITLGAIATINFVWSVGAIHFND